MAATGPALYTVLDERFGPCTSGDQQLETLATGCRWAEGPLYFPAGRYLLWSDIPNDRIMRWDEPTGTIGVFRSPAGNTNGHAIDRQGRLVSCEQGNRRVTRTEHDGSVTVLADTYLGQQLNSPNDVEVTSDGSIWFTDPDFGITSNYEGHAGTSEIGSCNVYRIDPATGELHLVVEGMAGPNGLVFSADETELFVCDSRANLVRRFGVLPDLTVDDGAVFVASEIGQFDNIRLDDKGWLWVAAGDDGVHCYHADGTLLGKLAVPELVANICFGGPKRNRMFLAANTRLYSLVTSVTGAPTTTPRGEAPTRGDHSR